MSEMGMMLKAINSGMGLHLRRNPAGSWSFCGSVPYSLSYARKDGAPVTEEEARKIAAHGLGLFRKTHNTRVWTTEAEARDAAQAAGYVLNCTCCKSGAPQ